MCSACDNLICTECLYDHDLTCKNAHADSRHSFLNEKDTTAITTKKNKRTLTAAEELRMAKSKEAATIRKAETTKRWIEGKRQAAPTRKNDKARALDDRITANRQKAKRRKICKFAREIIASNFDDPDAFNNDDEPPPDTDAASDNEPPPADLHEDNTPPTSDQHEEARADDRGNEDQSKAKKRRLTNEQKHQQAIAHHNAVKAIIGEEWRKHGAVKITEEYPRDPNTLKSEALQPNDLKAIHPSHHKMTIRNIIFCRRCGYSKSRKTQKLADPCNLKPKHADVKLKLKRMIEGMRSDRKVLQRPDGLSTQVIVSPVNLDGC